MTYLVILGAYFVTFAVIGVLSRKSLGIPTLALAAGSLIAQLWADSLTPLVAQLGLAIVHPPLTSIVVVLLTTLPALLVMIRAPKARSIWKSLVSSLVFAVGAVAVTYPAFERAVVLDDASKHIVEQIASHTPVALTIAIVFAVLEILFRKKKVKLPDEGGKQHK